MNEILTNKLEIPQRGVRIIHRGRLIDDLKRVPDIKLSLLVAPSGFGKTAMLVEWLSISDISKWCLAWITLDQTDNDPKKFWTYLAAGIKKGHPKFDYDIQSAWNYEFTLNKFSFLNPLINEISAIPYPVILILDDYHTINDPDIHDGLNYLLENQPNNLHIVISSQVPPPISFSRIRAHRQLIEFTSKNLAFTLLETNSFLKNIIGVDLDLKEVANLVDITEGWAVGLQLSAITLQDQSHFNVIDEDVLINNPQIHTYIEEEILENQSDPLKEFLIKTSIFEEFSPQLCDAIFDRTDSEELIHTLVKNNLFIERIDEHAGWYRYHPMFVAALKAILQRRSSKQDIPVLHQKTSKWLLENGYPTKAVDHAIASGNLEEAADIIESLAIKTVFEYDLISSPDWMDQITNEILEKRPGLGIYEAVGRFFHGNEARAMQILERTEKWIQNAHPAQTDVNLDNLEWQVPACRAIIESRSLQIDERIARIEPIIENTPSETDYFYGFLLHTLASTYEIKGDYEKAQLCYMKSSEVGLKHGFYISYIHSRSNFANLFKIQGELEDAENAHKETLNRVKKANLEPGVIAIPYTGLLEIRLERNELAEAHNLAAPIIEKYHHVIESKNTLDWKIIVYARLIKYFLAIQDFDNANLYLENLFLKTTDLDNRAIRVLCTPIDIIVNTLLAQESNEKHKFRILEIESELEHDTELMVGEKLALARIYLAHKEIEKAKALLEALEIFLQPTLRRECLLETEILLAKTYLLDGKNNLAIQKIKIALVQAMPENYIRIFLNEGKPIRDLLVQVVNTDRSDQASSSRNMAWLYAQRLLKEFNVEPKSSPSEIMESFRSAIVLEPGIKELSPREMDVIKLLMAGKSNKEISAILMVSGNTVKSHVRHICKKLKINTRRELVDQLQRQNILPEYQ